MKDAQLILVQGMLRVVMQELAKLDARSTIREINALEAVQRETHRSFVAVSRMLEKDAERQV